ncbi:[FeFe] hydrogenase H-cluster radical SAM maturase HydE [Clostridiales bacterium COT073_COT-073]|nr:[FeFe] hydrogenase H-cluster radical SAM maturase HydE [Clostridiales bacterium COT073_COT-073]
MELNQTNWTVEQLAELLALPDFSRMYAYADKINCQVHGDIIEIRAILEFSNICKRRCAYCGLNSQNSKVRRYRMSEKEIMETAIIAAEAGYRTLVMQSGEDDYFNRRRLGELVRQIKKQTGMAITVSCGEKSYEDYAWIRQAGADRYLLKHETADPDIYAGLHAGDALSNRLRCLKDIKELGFETGSGFMIGLPGQSLKTIAQDILLLKEIGCDMAGIGPFIPSPDTELKDWPAGSAELTKRAVALTRILLPDANLPATTALGVLVKTDKYSIFQCGANVIMRKVTPQKYEECYSIYPNQIEVRDIFKERKQLEQMIRGMGKIPR